MLLNSKVDKRKHYDKSSFIFSGIIFCSNCGSALLEAVKGKSLQCLKYAKGKCSESHGVSFFKIKSALKKALEFEFSKEILNISVDKSSGDILKTLLKKEKSKLEKINSAYENGVDSLQEYKIKKSEVFSRIKNFEEQISNFEKIFNRKIEMKFESVISALFGNGLSASEKNKILKFFIEKIIFNRKAGAIQIYYKI